MLSFLLVLLIAAFIAGFIWVLHRNQRRRTLETVDRTAPLPALEDDALPDFVPAPAATPAASSDNWLAQIKTLRESQQTDAALALCQTHFPKAQAFQQAAIILRQQIREQQEQGQPAGDLLQGLLQELFRTAALADLFRNGNPRKPDDALAALKAVHSAIFSYSSIGYSELKLLNKSDARALEQLWGSPAMHQHVEDVLGPEWLALCKTRSIP